MTDKNRAAWRPSRRDLMSGLGAAALAGCAGRAVAAAGSSPAAPPDPAQALTSLNGEWRFALGKTPADIDGLANFHQPDVDLGAFRATPVPSNWALQGYEKPQYAYWKGDFASEGFYLRHFDAPADWSERRVLLHFGGVWDSAEVWLNGQPLGRQDTGFNKISWDVTPQIKPGAANTLAVRVRQIAPFYRLDTNDDWALGGIYRDVTLETMPKLTWIDRVEARTRFDSDYRDADLNVRVMVGDKRRRPKSTVIMHQGDAPYVLRLTLFDADGKPVQQQDTRVPPHWGTGGETRIAMHVQTPLRWTAETPNLYRLRVDLIDGGRSIHVRELRIGFREISTECGVFRINGQPVKLRGVDRHDEYPTVGRATTPEQWRQDLTLMKAANINFLRLAHYPHAEGFLDLCDEMGMYVTDEIPFGFGGDDLEDHPDAIAAVMTRACLTVARDINRPCVVIWDVGNEDPLTSLHMTAIRAIKGLDPTRPLLIPIRAEDDLPPEIDILAPHYWSAQMYDDNVGVATRPVVTTEFSHAFGVDGFGGLEDRWKALTRHPQGAGGAVWLWADQGLMLDAVKADGTTAKALDVPTAGFDGIVDSFRNPTRDYWELKAVYAQVYPGVDAVDVIPGQPAVRVPIQNDFDFTDLSAVRMAWRLMADDRRLDDGVMTLSGGPHTASWLDLPLTALKDAAPGATAYFAFTFTRADGSEIARRSVELRSPPADVSAGALSRPVVGRTAAGVSVGVGDTAYVFDPASGELVSASYKGAARIAALKPTIWRPLNSTETLKLKRDFPDLNLYTPRVAVWSVDESGDGVRLHAEAACVVDSKNSFTVVYDYHVGADGVLSVRYSLLPKVEAGWLPHVGMDLRSPRDIASLRWLGLGPLDAWPNMKAAAALGVYGCKVAGADSDGMKATRWLELTDRSGSGVHIDSTGYVGFSPADPARARILSAVVGRPNKADRPEPPYELATDTGRPFAGAFSIRLNT